MNTRRPIANQLSTRWWCSGIQLVLLEVNKLIPVVLLSLKGPVVVVEVAIVKKNGAQLKYGLELWVFFVLGPCSTLRQLTFRLLV